MFAIGNDELAPRPRIAIGSEISCSHCGERHVLRGSRKVLPDGTLDAPSDMLLTYTCGEKSYLAGVDGKLLPGLEA